MTKKLKENINGVLDFNFLIRTVQLADRPWIYQQLNPWMDRKNFPLNQERIKG